MKTFGIVVACISIIAAASYRFLSTNKEPSLYRKTKIDKAKAERGVAAGAVRSPTSFRERILMFISIAVLGSALFIILTDRYDTGSQKWAFGAVGSIVGFWLRPGR